ncbi:MAG: 3-phosphoshikimate 1-carboxyvinyltransferase, partial [Clostridiales bacterium]
MNVRITPRPLTGRVRAIASKSAAHRALICAALARRCAAAGENGTGAFTALCARFERDETGFEPSEDILATIGCLKALLGAQAGAAPCLDCGESGSTLRFLLPVAAAVAGEAFFTGRGRLPERPLGALRTVMEAHGCRFSAPSLPFTVSGRLSGG